MNRPLKLVTLLAALATTVALAPRSAHAADIQKSGPEEWPGKNEVSAHVGFQAGLNNYLGGGTPSGFKLVLDYSYRFHELVWLNFGANLVFGGGGCDAFGNCGFAGNGNTAEPYAGVKLKWKTPIPLVPYAKADIIFAGIYNRYCGDNGFAFGLRVAGGVKYFLLKWLGLGVELGFTGGPAFYEGTGNCSFQYKSHTEFYAAFDFVIGAEFIF